MTDEQIITWLADGLKRPTDRETERWRYTVYLIEQSCSWRTEEEIASMPRPLPLFGGPREEHIPMLPDGRASVPVEDLGCNGCAWIYSGDSEHVLVYDDSKGKNLIARARKGDRDADAVLCIIASRHTEKGTPLPQHLGEYVTDLLEQRIDEAKYSEGGNRHANFSRNIRISLAVKVVREQCGKNQTRAIQLVQKALEKIGVHISSDGIRKVLKRPA
jgi:hypothetical protein